MSNMAKDEREYYLSLFALAGITGEEWMDHPEHGLLINEAGVRKLTRIAPDRAQAVRSLEEFEKLFEKFRSDNNNNH